MKKKEKKKTYVKVTNLEGLAGNIKATILRGKLELIGQEEQDGMLYGIISNGQGTNVKLPAERYEIVSNSKKEKK